MRDSIGAWVCMRIKGNAVRMITQETGKVSDVPSRPKGRALVFMDGEKVDVQLPWSTPEEINELCLSPQEPSPRRDPDHPAAGGAQPAPGGVPGVCLALCLQAQVALTGQAVRQAQAQAQAGRVS